MKLATLIVADPLPNAAELLADQCARLAHQRIVVSGGEELLSMAQALRPQLVMFSLELTDDKPEALVKKLRKTVPDGLLIATFRELAVSRMGRLNKLGVDELTPQPVNVIDVFRAASTRFQIAFRRHDRFNVAIQVSRADGVVLGKTTDISEGGMCLATTHPLHEDVSLLVSLFLPGDPRPLRVRYRVLSTDGQPDEPLRVRGSFENLRGGEHRRLAGYLRSLTQSGGAK